jgi:abortive infection bacteriophage resistance protein
MYIQVSLYYEKNSKKENRNISSKYGVAKVESLVSFRILVSLLSIRNKCGEFGEFAKKIT